nr:TMV resistance protein N-like [Ipomoea trifida]
MILSMNWRVSSMTRGTDKIEGVALNFRAATDVKISSEAFTHMTKLRLLKIHNANASQVPSFLPCELRWLDWHGYPSKCLPASFQGEKLVGLKMQYSRVIQLWKGLKFDKLPDELGQMDCLEVLYCDGTAIQKPPSSISLLKNLKTLSFRGYQGDNHMVDALWQHLLKGLSIVDDNFSICLPGIVIPEWFTYKNSGPSIAVSLPQNWYNNKFMGFAVCVVSDLTSTSLSWSSNYLKKTHGIRVLFSFRTRGGRNLSYGINIGSLGSDENVDSEHTCLAYVSFDSFWWVYNKMVHSPNEWCQVEVSADRFSRGHLLLTGFGMRLVYEDDVEQQMNQTKSIQSDGKMGLFPAIFNGSKYVKKKRLGYYDFSRLPPEAQHQDS